MLSQSFRVERIYNRKTRFRRASSRHMTGINVPNDLAKKELEDTGEAQWSNANSEGHRTWSKECGQIRKLAKSLPALGTTSHCTTHFICSDNTRGRGQNSHTYTARTHWTDQSAAKTCERERNRRGKRLLLIDPTNWVINRQASLNQENRYVWQDKLQAFRRGSGKANVTGAKQKWLRQRSLLN